MKAPGFRTSCTSPALAAYAARRPGVTLTLIARSRVRRRRSERFAAPFEGD